MPVGGAGYVSAVDREVQWLTAVDTLPALLTANGGLLDQIVGYWPRTPAVNKRVLYLIRRDVSDVREANQRALLRHQFEATIRWPISTSTSPAETAQRNLDLVVDQVIGRVRGLLTDHSHGGRFLSAGEDPHNPRAVFADPERAVRDREPLEARLTWYADDLERFI